MNVFELFGKIAIDGSGAMSGIDQTVGHAKKAENNLSKTFKKIGGMVAAAFSVRAVVDFGKQCTQAYASIAAEESAFAQIMGDYADTAQAKLNAVADQTGITSTRMTGAMTSLTAKFKGLGYDVEDATTLATDGLLIAADAAAFWDMSLDESMSHLNSFINGSYEGGEAIGLFANDTQMAAYAVEQGIVADTKAWAALDEATKQATRLDYAKKMMQNSGATGQAAKEADAYANVMANLKESWRQFQGVVGKPILEKLVLPAMQKLNEFMPILTEGVQNGINWLENGFDKIKEYFTEVFTEKGIKWDALPDAMSKTFKGIERKVGGWLSGVGRKVQNSWNTTVQPAIRNLASTFGIELPDVDLGSIFASFNAAYENVKITASTFYTDVKNAFAKDVDGKIQLNAALSGLFDAGVKAMKGLLTDASTLVTDIVGKITGNKEDAEKIGKVFSELFGVAGEVVIGIKDDAVAIFDWFVNNGELAGAGIAAVATGLAMFAAANPAIFGIMALSLLIGALTVDWANFEENYPALVDMFEDLTGLDFTNVANSVDNFKSSLEGLVGWFAENQATLNTIFVLLGGLIFPAHPVAGTALIALGGGTAYSNAKKEFESEESTSFAAKLARADEDVNAAVKNGTTDKLTGWDWYQYNIGLPFVQFIEDLIGEADKNNKQDRKVIEPWNKREFDYGETGGANSLQVITAAVREGAREGAKEGAQAGCTEGVGNITVTGTITTGNVMLNESALVGKIAPKVNMKLGNDFGRTIALVK